MTDPDKRPLDSADDAFLRQAGRAFLVNLYAALRSLKLYPVENAAVQRALDELQDTAGTVLAREGDIEIRISGDFLSVNGTRLRLELDNYASFSHVQSLLRAFDIGHLTVQDAITRQEWQAFLSMLLGLVRDKDCACGLLDSIGVKIISVTARPLSLEDVFVYKVMALEREDKATA